MANKFSVDALLPDEATDNKGKCGIYAFAKSLLAQMTKMAAWAPGRQKVPGRNKF